ncbi:ABC transporter ATP-binding protein [Schaalia sp. lx-260]|uniref:ABC transporter ATP-binding protein n=1 Tax=Schaalia sp. lx-260 TaxID=2899082 RepID=UPI001E5FCA55|nr:ATP-binding cassette domain-containing protein [Schaalia sp. lx-260]MCD4550218.1 ATP-binding cassette domain-containing protein [Schaalia sp. lx-260]
MLLEAHALGHSFDGQHELFSDLSFRFTAGDMVAVIGPSGSGKSTLLSILAGWLSPTRGHITREGIDSISWVFQNPLGFKNRSTLDHVCLPLLAKGFTRREAYPRALETLAIFGLEHLADKRFSELSGGEAQRLMLAKAHMKAPDLLLVDEPTAQLDRTLAASVNKVLSHIASTHTIVIVATHDSDTHKACHSVLDLGKFASPQQKISSSAQSIHDAHDQIAPTFSLQSQGKQDTATTTDRQEYL